MVISDVNSPLLMELYDQWPSRKTHVPETMKRNMRLLNLDISAIKQAEHKRLNMRRIVKKVAVAFIYARSDPIKTARRNPELLMLYFIGS